MISSAHSEKPKTLSRSEMEEISASMEPRENSPFFIEREEARQAAAAASNPGCNTTPRTPRHSTQQLLKNVGKACLSILQKPFHPSALEPSAVEISPTFFSVETTPELEVSLRVFNRREEMIFLDFPTNQRIEILIKEKKGGATILRWSEDRSFEPIESVLTINPKESVLYTEKISTSLLKNGVTYFLQVSLVGHPEYTITQEITPQQAQEFN